MSEPTPALAADNATRPDAIELGDLAVIGIINGQSGAAALLRSSRGDIARVAPGDEVFGVTVTAIGGNQVLLTNWLGRTEAKTVAGS